MQTPRVVQITDRTVLPVAEIFARIERVGHTGRRRAGGFALLFRDKDQAAPERRDVALRLREATARAGCRLVVAADVVLAREVGADGVHLPSDALCQVASARFGPEAWVSIACHGADEVERAAAAGVNAVLLSPIFGTPGKGAPLGVEAIAEARRRLARHPGVGLVALGGVEAARTRACFDAGADGVASIRADLTSLV